MGKHDHASCLHNDIHYCRHCNVVYCNACDITWHQYNWTCVSNTLNGGFRVTPTPYYGTVNTTAGNNLAQMQNHTQLHGSTSG